MGEDIDYKFEAEYANKRLNELENELNVTKDELSNKKSILHIIKTVLKVDYEEVPEYRKLILYIDYVETKEKRPFEEIIKDFNKF